MEFLQTTDSIYSHWFNQTVDYLTSHKDCNSYIANVCVVVISNSSALFGPFSLGHFLTGIHLALHVGIKIILIFF